MILETEIDKRRVRQSFSRQAHVYEENAPMQKEVAEKLITLVSSRFTVHDSRFTALDIGIGTGFASKEVSKMFPKGGIFGCDIARGMLKQAGKTGAVLTEADAEQLPYKNNTFDLVFSSLAFQWTNLCDPVKEAFRVLKPERSLCFATFGDETLRELGDSYDSAREHLISKGVAKTMKFVSSEKIKTLMETTGFKNIEVKTDLINICYDSPEALLHSLKNIGAGNLSKGFHPSRSLLHETFRIYKERYGNEDGVSATFEVVYALGVKR